MQIKQHLKKNYALKTLFSTLPLASLIGFTAYTSIQKSEIPLVDIIV